MNQAFASSKLADSRLAKPRARIAAVAGLLVLAALGALILVNGFPDDPRYWRTFLLGLLLAVLASVPAVVLLRYLDRRDPEPWSTASIAYLWGAVVATGFGIVLRARLVESLFLAFDEAAGLFRPTESGVRIHVDLFEWLDTAVAAPMIEETLKALALVLLVVVFPGLVNGVRDGLVYGALVGLGFAVVEAAVYIGYWYANAGSFAFIGELVPRFVFFGVNGHLIYTALFGAGLGIAVLSERGWVAKTLTIIGGLLLAISAHAMFNAFGPVSLLITVSIFGLDPGVVDIGELWWLSALAVLMTYAWAYVVLIYLTVRSGYSELDVIKAQLPREAPPVVTIEELELIQTEGLWRLRRVPDLPRRTSIYLVRAQNRLAFRRSLMDRNSQPIDSDEALGRLRELIPTIRERFTGDPRTVTPD